MATDFGTDLSCVTDLSGDGRTVTGRRLLAEAVARRWITPRGRLLSDPNYGFDITERVNDDMSARDLASMRAGMQAEALKDERIRGCEVTVILNVVGVLTITAIITDADGPFRLVLEASSVTAKILEIT